MQSVRRVKKKFKILLSLILMVLTIVFVILTCQPTGGATEEDEPDIDIPDEYVGAGSHGDLIYYDFDRNGSSGTFRFYNETTGKSGSGTFTVMNDASFDGVYEVTYESQTYYAIEIEGKMAVTTVPSGNVENKIVYAVAKSAGVTYTDLAGQYTWIQYLTRDDGTIDTMWGGFKVTTELSGDGRYKFTSGFVPEDIDPNSFGENFAKFIYGRCKRRNMVA